MRGGKGRGGRGRDRKLLLLLLLLLLLDVLSRFVQVYSDMVGAPLMADVLYRGAIFHSKLDARACHG